LWITAVLIVLGASAASAQGDDRSNGRIGGHIGFVLPLITHAGGQNTSLADNFAIGFPMGITLKGTGKTAFDLELVPAIQDSPRQVGLTVHPGLLRSLGHNFTFGMRLAFDASSAQFGFTPLLNKSWPIEHNFFKAYFVEAVLLIRFNRPVGGPSTNPVTFGMHFGVGF